MQRRGGLGLLLLRGRHEQRRRRLLKGGSLGRRGLRLPQGRDRSEVGGGPVSSIMGGGPLDRAAAMIGTPMAKFEYVGRQLRRSQPGPHTDTMLAEVLEEARLGRIVGPLRAPHWWPGRTVALHCLEGDLFAAAAFAISQPDGEGGTKIRRGEDWHRSADNSTVATDDAPTHHMVQDFAGRN